MGHLDLLQDVPFFCFFKIFGLVDDSFHCLFEAPCSKL
jgi:hypothetical protein